MNKKLGILSLVLVTSLASNVFAGPKKNAPRNSSALEKALSEAGEKHFTEKMKINKVGPVKVKTDAEYTYYHVYNAQTKEEKKNDTYRTIIFDNTPTYLGYYLLDYEAVQYEDGAILYDVGNMDEDGNDIYGKMPLTQKGPPAKINFQGMPCEFIKNEKLEPKEGADVAGTTKKADDEIAAPEHEFREWVLTFKGKKIPVRAMYIKHDTGKVYLRAEASGEEKGFPLSMLSKEDRKMINEYK